jgi:nucleoid DNA-binding protein
MGKAKKPKGNNPAKAAAKTGPVVEVKHPEKLTAVSMAQYISAKYSMPGKRAKEIMEDFFDLIHTGVMNGQRVPVGKIGKMYINVRPARKERMGRNPLTGETIMIKAKPETKVPRFSFSKAFKVAASQGNAPKKKDQAN